MAWYNTYRPQSFQEVLGQNLVKEVLMAAVAQDKVRHAYLFAGPKGVGKTTLARIFAQSLNNVNLNPESSIDIIEINAASNTGIDDIRQLIESAQIPPLSGKYKIYIIDEVHMLSKPAMNALLKILEEPPKYLVFLLATTEPEKLIPTVHSRLTTLKLYSHSQHDLVQNLRSISQKECLTIHDDSLQIIAERAEGSQRDAINLLETVAAYNLQSYDQQTTAKIIGAIPKEVFEQLLTYFSPPITNPITSKQLVELIQYCEELGIDGETLLIQFFDYCLKLSLEGRLNLHHIIQPLGTILSKKLPISSIISAISLLNSYIPQSSLNEIGLTQTTGLINQEQSPIQKSNKTIDQKNSDDTSNTPTINTPAIHEPPSQNVTSNITIPEANRFVQHIVQKKDSPSMLKMMVQDMLIESINGQQITLSVSNPIFLAQLNTPALKSWLQKNISELHGSGELTVLVTSRNSNQISTPQPVDTTQDNLQPTSVEKVPEELVQNNEVSLNQTSDSSKTTDFSSDNIVNPPLTKNNLISGKDNKTEQMDEKIFYCVYGQLPAEIKDSPIPVFTGEIPEPQKQNKQDSENWNSHLTEFEFE